jgi:hypothetical protein
MQALHAITRLATAPGIAALVTAPAIDARDARSGTASGRP